jgi:hypothetical protein
MTSRLSSAALRARIDIDARNHRLTIRRRFHPVGLRKRHPGGRDAGQAAQVYR